mgnify:CR=1 FL=1
MRVLGLLAGTGIAAYMFFKLADQMGWTAHGVFAAGLYAGTYLGYLVALEVLSSFGAVGLAIAALLLSAAVTTHGGETMIVAHRGASRDAPEIASSSYHSTISKPLPTFRRTRIVRPSSAMKSKMLIVIALASYHYVMLQRNLLYTAVSRAKNLVVLVGTRRAIAIAVRNNKITERHTALDTRLRE